MYAYSYKLYPFIYSNFLFLILLIIRGGGVHLRITEHA